MKNEIIEQFSRLCKGRTFTREEAEIIWAMISPCFALSGFKPYKNKMKASEFAEEILGIKLHNYQKDFIDSNKKIIIK